MPRTFTAKSRRNFVLDRRRRYLAWLPGPPSSIEAVKIDSLVRIEWAALKAENEGTIAADREGREHRRLFDRLLSDFERSLKPAQKASEQPKLHEIVGGKRGRG